MSPRSIVNGVLSIMTSPDVTPLFSKGKVHTPQRLAGNQDVKRCIELPDKKSIQTTAV
jgi:hypothetical protein